MRIHHILLVCGILLFAQEALSVPTSEVTFMTTDSVTIHATLYLREGTQKSPALVLFHMLRRQRQDWETLARDAVQAGFVVLTIDLRGHGQSTKCGSRTINMKDFSNVDFAAMMEDVRSAVNFVKKEATVDTNCISLIGASIGANLALRYAAADTTIRSVVLLSPGLEYRGLTTEAAMKAYGNRPALLIAARDDDYSSDSVQKLAMIALGPAKQQLYDNAGHGTFMFEAEPGFGKLILDWLKSGAE
jgi:pimeloyl-ACP methyl ester carboxylesterase